MTTLLISPFGAKVNTSNCAKDYKQASAYNLPTSTRQITTNFLTPATNIKKIPAGYELQLSMPGFSKENVKIMVENNTLIIEGNKETVQIEGEKILYKEFSQQNFRRTFSMGETLDSNSVEANFQNGILTINIANKQVAEQAKAINISVN